MSGDLGLSMLESDYMRGALIVLTAAMICGLFVMFMGLLDELRHMRDRQNMRRVERQLRRREILEHRARLR